MRIAFAEGKTEKEDNLVCVLFIRQEKKSFSTFAHRPPKEPFVLPTNRADSTSLSTGLEDEEGKGVEEEEEEGMCLVGLPTVERA